MSINVNIESRLTDCKVSVVLDTAGNPYIWLWSEHFYTRLTAAEAIAFGNTLIEHGAKCEEAQRRIDAVRSVA